jgi:membrane-bound serine protease (ClpP class)
MDISNSEITARFLSSPLWRVALVVLGLIALFLELKSPGHGFGFAGFAICLGMFFWLQIFAQNAGVVELALFGAGAVLVAFELFVLPTFGALGFVGIMAVIVSIVLAFLPEGSLPGLLGVSSKPPEYLMRQIVEGMEWATLALLSIIGFFTLVWWKGVKLPGFSRLSLNTVNAGSIHSGHVQMHEPQPARSLAPLVGQTAVVESVLRPSGKIRYGDATYDAISEGDYIEGGSKVVILKVANATLVVRKI